MFKATLRAVWCEPPILVIARYERRIENRLCQAESTWPYDAVTVVGQ